MNSKFGSCIATALVATALVTGCGGASSSSPPPATPEAEAVPPDSPLAKIHKDMGTREVTDILGQPYDTMEYATGKEFIPFYSAWGGDTYRVAWRYRGVGRVIMTRPHAYMTDMRVLKVEYDPKEGGGRPPAPATNEAPAAADTGPPPDRYDDRDPSALTDFHPTLDPYGTWADDPTYGTVWVPSVGPDFTPYSTAGHWVHDGGDWVWVSDYEWGAIPFHYGRWTLIDGRGWAWIPGREYRGAWVNWQVDDGYTYMGWAPAPPEFVWRGGAPVEVHVDATPRWVYVPRAEVFSPVVGTRLVGGPAAVSIGTRMHVLAPVRPGVHVAGPPPERLGYAAERVPRPSEPEKAKLLRAQQMAQPSTAQAVGGHPPTRALVNHGPGPGGPGPGAAAAGEGHGGGPTNRQLTHRGNADPPRQATGEGPRPQEGPRPGGEGPRPQEGPRSAAGEGPRPQEGRPQEGPQHVQAQGSRPVQGEGSRPASNEGNAGGHSTSAGPSPRAMGPAATPTRGGAGGGGKHH